MTKVRYTLLYICICSLAVLASCGKGGKRAAEADKQTVTVTIEPFRYFVDQLSGGRLEVNTMVPAGSNPETYEPTAQQMVRLSESSLYLKVGQIGFETTWMKRLQQNAPHLKVVDTSTGITPAKTPSGTTDPHTWMSCSSARVIAANIYKALCEIQPQDSALFRSNHQRLLASIDSLDADIRTQIKGVEGKSFVIYHPALTYFARDYHLCQLPIEEEGREPSARQVQALIDRAQKEKITTVFIQREFGGRNMEMFLKATKAQPTEINPLSYEWVEEMVRVTNSLTPNNGLTPGPSPRRGE